MRKRIYLHGSKSVAVMKGRITKTVETVTRKKFIVNIRGTTPVPALRVPAAGLMLSDICALWLIIPHNFYWKFNMSDDSLSSAEQIRFPLDTSPHQNTIWDKALNTRWTNCCQNPLCFVYISLSLSLRFYTISCYTEYVTHVRTIIKFICFFYTGKVFCKRKNVKSSNKKTFYCNLTSGIVYLHICSIYWLGTNVLIFFSKQKLLLLN